MAETVTTYLFNRMLFAIGSTVMVNYQVFNYCTVLIYARCTQLRHTSVVEVTLTKRNGFLNTELY